MNDLFLMGLAFIAGIMLGGLFFGGLWWTLEHHLQSENPLPWLLGSMFLRMAILVLGLFFVASGDWRRALIGLLGIMIGRFVITRYARFSQPVKTHDS